MKAMGREEKFQLKMAIKRLRRKKKKLQEALKKIREGKAMERDYEKPTVALEEENGDAFAIVGRVSRALVMAGAGLHTARQYQAEAMNGDYAHLLQVTAQYVNTEIVEEAEDDDEGNC